MHAIFVAHGPLADRIKHTQSKRKRSARRSPLYRKKAKRDISVHEEITVIPGFDNLEIYNLVTKKLLRMNNVAKQNGTDGFWDQYLDD